MPVDKCPDRLEIEQYLECALDSQAESRLDRHFESCSQCRHVIDEIDRQANAVFAPLRRSNTNVKLDVDASGRQTDLIQRLMKLPNSTNVLQGMNPSEEFLKENYQKLIGHNVGQYQLLDVIKASETDIIYRACDLSCNKNVAIKFLNDQPLHQFNSLRQNIKKLFALKHSNVVRLIEAGDHQGSFYFVMEFITGLTLSKLSTRAGSLSVSGVCTLIQQAANGLQAIHGLGVMYGGIRLSKCMLNMDGQLKILYPASSEFNERAIGKDVPSSLEGELQPGDKVTQEDISMDLDRLGGMFCHLLYGEPLIDTSEVGESSFNTDLNLTKQIQSMLALREDVPQELQQIILQRFGAHSDLSWNSIEELVTALEPFCDRKGLKLF